jgi:hypothetical protein
MPWRGLLFFPRQLTIYMNNWILERIRSPKKDKGQSMVEFVIALPILLFVLFGIIEFGRLTFAWMAVQNAARFGIRYAVTGEYNEIYCVQAGANLGPTHVNADVHGGDPQDCIIPDSYPGVNGNDLERDLIDLARLFSIRDAAVGGGTGLWLEPAVSGNYEQFLDSHDVAFVGMAAEKGFIHVTTCSNRGNQFAVDYNNFDIPLCVDNINAELMDDAGGPGDRVKVHVEHQHPLFLPLLSNLWPSVNLNAERDGIVEKFRTSRVIGVSGPILSAPTWTQTPTITDTPTITPTSTPTATSSPTNTPIPVQCDQIEIVSSYVGHYSSGNHGVVVTIRNNNPVPIHLFRVDQEWEKNDPGRYLWTMRFYTADWYNINDSTPPTNWIPVPPIQMPAAAVGEYVALFEPQHLGLEGNTSVDLEFDDGCHKGVTINMPTATPTPTPTITNTPTITPTPDCDLYSLGVWNFRTWAIQRINVRNNDVVDTDLVSLELIWDYAETYGAANGYNGLNVDWFSWAGFYFPGHGQGGDRDDSSSTTWNGTLPFDAGRTYRWEVDFDGDWGGGGPLTGVQNSDFGIRAQFANGCTLVRNAVPRGVETWTPSPTPTGTFTPSPPPPPTNTPLPSNTPPPTWTPLPTYTPSITWTASATLPATNTPVPSATSWPTSTPLPPTSTRTPIPSSTAPPPPTATSTPIYTSTFTPIPTWTPACPLDDPEWPCQPTWTPGP